MNIYMPGYELDSLAPMRAEMAAGERQKNSVDKIRPDTLEQRQREDTAVGGQSVKLHVRDMEARSSGQTEPRLSQGNVMNLARNIEAQLSGQTGSRPSQGRDADVGGLSGGRQDESEKFPTSKSPQDIPQDIPQDHWSNAAIPIHFSSGQASAMAYAQNRYKNLSPEERKKEDDIREKQRKQRQETDVPPVGWTPTAHGKPPLLPSQLHSGLDRHRHNRYTAQLGQRLNDAGPADGYRVKPVKDPSSAKEQSSSGTDTPTADVTNVDEGWGMRGIVPEWVYNRLPASQDVIKTMKGTAAAAAPLAAAAAFGAAAQYAQQYGLPFVGGGKKRKSKQTRKRKSKKIKKKKTKKTRKTRKTRNKRR